MSEQIYAVNTSHGNLTLKAGYLTIPLGGYITIQEEDKSHVDFRYAFAKQWVSYTTTKPDTKAVPAIKPIEFFEPNQGMTEEELRADNAKSKDKPEEAPGKSEALGESELTVGEPTVTKLGEEQETGVATSEAIGAVSEPKKGRGKKAAE